MVHRASSWWIIENLKRIIMAKKKVEEVVYPVAPLVIAKEKFTELLTSQIEQGKRFSSQKLLELQIPIQL